jgi:SMI1-KNR4 cell-wall
MLDDLKKVLPVPRLLPPEHDEEAWRSVETRIGGCLPTDYKDFMTVYGTGCIDGFLWVFNPFSTNTHLNLVDQSGRIFDSLRIRRDEFGQQLPFAVFPEETGVFPWGVTDNGDTLFWRYHNGVFEHPVVIIEARGPDWVEINLSTTEFIFKVLTQNIIVQIFPDDFPLDKHVFLPEDWREGRKETEKMSGQ